MKTRIVLLLTILFIGSIPITPIIGESVNTPPAPEFVSITPDGTPAGSMIFDINETITITYSTDRHSVDGVMLLGTGSNLTENINDVRVVNFTKTSSFKDKSTYEVDINVTSFTVLYAYTWSVSLENGTKEVFDTFDSVEGHQLWVFDGPSYPRFVDVVGSVSRSAGYYAPDGNNVTIVYEVDDPYDNSTVTLAFGNNRTELFNSTTGVYVSMIKIDRSSANVSRFEYNYTMSQRIVFFSAFSETGWERQELSSNSPNIHIITNGFSFEKSFSQDVNEYTNIDTIELNVTAYNKTIDDKLFVRYRVFENSSSDIALQDWIDIALIANISYSLVNDTNNFNTSKLVYNTVINEQFNVSQIVEVQSYVNFKTSSFNESKPVRIEIHDARPSIKISSFNETITQLSAVNVTFSFSTIRGSIVNATLTSNYTSPIDIKNKINATVSFTNSSDLIVEGNHTVEIIVFNDLNQSRKVIIIYSVDITAPEVSFLDTSSTRTDRSGKVTVDFNFEDNFTGVKFAELNWGDGIVINVTDLTSANHVYRNNGTGSYTVVLKVYDKAGNIAEITLTITADVTIPSAETVRTPINFVFSVFALGIIVITLRRRK